MTKRKRSKGQNNIHRNL